MTSRRLSIASSFVLIVGMLIVSGLTGPAATAFDPIIEFVNQPEDARIGELITAEPFDPSGEGDYVTVRVTQRTNAGIRPIVGAVVTFELAGGSGAGPAAFSVTPEETDAGGHATFDEQLAISVANEPLSTDYLLIPVVSGVQGDPSDGFDVWDGGCSGSGCEVSLTTGRSSSDTYTTTEDVDLSASEIPLGDSDTTIVCAKQLLVFSTVIFFHETTGTGPVFLVTHITREDMKPPNNRLQIGWCVGVKVPGPWSFPRQDTNGSGGLDEGDLYVGLAPKCPATDAMSFAPCIVSRTSDGSGGLFIRGWLPGGDPPRRT